MAQHTETKLTQRGTLVVAGLAGCIAAAALMWPVHAFLAGLALYTVLMTRNEKRRNRIARAALRAAGWTAVAAALYLAAAGAAQLHLGVALAVALAVTLKATAGGGKATAKKPGPVRPPQGP